MEICEIMPRPNCHRKACNRARYDLAALLTRRRLPLLNGMSFCSRFCLGAHFEDETRAWWNRLQQERERRIPRPRLGSILLETAQITQQQLDEAVARQRAERHGRLGEWLIRLGFVDERQVTLALSKQFGLPLLKLSDSDTPSEAARLIPGMVASRSRLLPVGYDEPHDALRVAVSGPVSFSFLEAVRRMLGKGVISYLGDESSIESLIRRWYQPEELDFTLRRTFDALEDLREIVNAVVDSAVEHRCENIQAVLLDSCFWIRLDVDGYSEHLVYSHSALPSGGGAGIDAGARSFGTAGSRDGAVLAQRSRQELPPGFGNCISMLATARKIEEDRRRLDGMHIAFDKH
jgi:hypothetical protein